MYPAVLVVPSSMYATSAKEMPFDQPQFHFYKHCFGQNAMIAILAYYYESVTL
jgi:hypothetical protein